MTEDTREGTAPVQALVVVDVQTAFVSGAEAVPDARRIRENTALLRERAHRAGALVVQLQNDGEPGAPDEPGTPGWRLHLPPAEGEYVLRKTVDDGFEETDLRERLDAAGVRALAVCGVLSEMCVSATARTALRLGYRVVLPHDAHATYDVPAAEDISGVVPAAMAARAAEWALGDEIEIVPFARDVRFTAG
ncbi:isochorismatase family protein [Streptomyces cacaoi]|uniref:isochorismatase family protein n=1 Tax=Streptomyces cacaoi TaxID=1898 RepID=UPI000A39C0DF|nr:isochorismatase family protein [Streptomyces cacaoi]NNG87637.1 isochorismatase family protein [Streptomyces cacaoi]